MKKRTKIILLVIGIITVVFVSIVIVYLKKVHRPLNIERDPDIVEAIETIEASYEELYSEKWIFNGVGKLDEEREVHTSFRLKEGKLDERKFENMSKIYNAIVPVIRECLGEKYASYPLRITFSAPNRGGDYIVIICTDNNKTVKMKCCSEGLSLKELVRVFPELNELDNITNVNGYNCFKYDSIEEIAGFEDLRMIDFQVKLTDEEKEYIWSLYPNCEIMEESFYEYRMEE